MKGRSIEDRPAIVSQGTEIGHWEVDTVVGQRKGREAVTFTAVEKVTRNYIAIRIPGRNSAGVESAMEQLIELYGKERFSQVFKTMTADNGPEFETFSKFETLVPESTLHIHTAHGSGLRMSDTTACCGILSPKVRRWSRSMMRIS